MKKEFHLRKRKWNLMKKDSGDPENFLYGILLFNRHNGQLFFRSSLTAAIMMFIFKKGSRNASDNGRESEESVRNYESISDRP